MRFVSDNSNFPTLMSSFPQALAESHHRSIWFAMEWKRGGCRRKQRGRAQSTTMMKGVGFGFGGGEAFDLGQQAVWGELWTEMRFD